MTPLHSHCRDLDLHRLDLRFAGSRLMEPHAVAAYSGDRERPIRSIVNTNSGDHEHPIALA